MYKHSIDDGQRDDIDININQRKDLEKPQRIRGLAV